jgi:D-glycero-alpha-D-manno-heptose 1-phosphate guanylyltransferase
MQSIILAGGYGTRLRHHIVADVPKPMAPVSGKPFLEYVLTWLSRNGINETVIATGYMGEKITEYFAGNFNNMNITYSHEDTPLLTGGAVKKALNHCSDKSVFVINGDTYFNVLLSDMKSAFDKQAPDMLVAVKELSDFDRYGELTIEDGLISGFHEKRYCKNGFINGGVYLIRRDLLDGSPNKFSLETDFMQENLMNLRILSYVSDGYFIDIGVPDDYAAVQIAFRYGLPR